MISRWHLGFLFYFFFLLLLAPAHLLSFDSYYYWDWSRHLALGYYDGSPMIAYFIRLATFLFGDTLFALNAVSILCTGLSALLLHQTARLFLNQTASAISVGLWLFSPLVTLDLLRQTTYDNPLSLFWALSFYFAARFLHAGRFRYLYALGFSLGCLLLSKYSGIVLFLPLTFLLLSPSYRYLFRTPHLYGALLLSLLMFSPVLFWNAQHHWQSFLYQLSNHRLKDHLPPGEQLIKSFFSVFLPALNLMLLPPLLCYLKCPWKESPAIVKLCRSTCTLFLCFYLLLASLANIRSNWLTPYLMSSALLAGYCFQTLHKYRSSPWLISAYGIASLCILLNSCSFFGFLPSSKRLRYQLIQDINASSLSLPTDVFSLGWLDARMLFFLKHHPNIHSIDCGFPENQYSVWKQEQKNTVQNALIITGTDDSTAMNCLKKQFQQCAKIASFSQQAHSLHQTLFVYQCTHHDNA